MTIGQRWHDRMTLANAEQVRAIVEPTAQAAASAAIREFVSSHPHFAPPPAKAEIPPPLKWAAIIISGIMAFVATASIGWGVKTLNDLQLTVARIDERQQQDTTRGDIIELKQRVSVLEQERFKQ